MGSDDSNAVEEPKVAAKAGLVAHANWALSVQLSWAGIGIGSKLFHAPSRVTVGERGAILVPIGNDTGSDVEILIIDCDIYGRWRLRLDGVPLAGHLRIGTSITRIDDLRDQLRAQGAETCYLTPEISLTIEIGAFTLDISVLPVVEPHVDMHVSPDAKRFFLILLATAAAAFALVIVLPVVASRAPAEPAFAQDFPSELHVTAPIEASFLERPSAAPEPPPPPNESPPIEPASVHKKAKRADAAAFRATEPTTGRPIPTTQAHDGATAPQQVGDEHIKPGESSGQRDHDASTPGDGLDGRTPDRTEGKPRESEDMPNPERPKDPPEQARETNGIDSTGDPPVKKNPGHRQPGSPEPERRPKIPPVDKRTWTISCPVDRSKPCAFGFSRDLVDQARQSMTDSSQTACTAAFRDEKITVTLDDMRIVVHSHHNPLTKADVLEILMLVRGQRCRDQ